MQEEGEIMSKTRYRWWGYVKNIIRAYPQYAEELADMKTQKITAAYSITPRGSSGASRTVERLAFRELPETEQREFEAVQRAVNETLRMKDGAERINLITLVFWKRTHTLHGAATACCISYGTAKKWHNRFIETVAALYGLL